MCDVGRDLLLYHLVCSNETILLPLTSEFERNERRTSDGMKRENNDDL